MILAKLVILAADAAAAAAGEGAHAAEDAAAAVSHEPSGFHNFMEIVTKPDNIPIVAMLFLVIYFFWLAMKMGLENDRLTERGEKDKVYEKMNRWVYGETGEEGEKG